MNPRTFCRESSYESTIALTFSFDPIFFERIVLPDLWAGGTGEVIVIADRTQTESALLRAVGQVRHLGRSYYLCQALSRGAMHAKLLLRLGAKGALLWIGSGNLTSSGWGGNLELAMAWRVEPENSSGAFAVRTLLEAVSNLVGDSVREIITRALDWPWAASATADSDRVILMSGVHGSLAAQLSRRWHGRRFQRVRILTSSTDRDGAFLLWAAETFGVTEALVGLDPALSDFDAVKLETLPLDVHIVPIVPSPDEHRPLHAKLVWFEGNDGCSAVVGSANCSAAAWLVPPEAGGNVELVVAFDDCRPEDFAESLRLLDVTTASRPTSVLVTTPEVTPPKSEEGIDTVRLVELVLREGLGDIVAVVEPALGLPRSVEVEFSGLRARLDREDKDGRRWIGPPPDLPITIATHFGHLVIRYADRVLRSTSRWLDEQDELRHVSQGRRIASSVLGLARPAKPSEQRKLLEDLAWIATTILSGSTEFPDPPSGLERASAERTTASPPVDPHQLVRRLSDLEELSSDRSRTSPTLGLPLLGVMRVLFPQDHQTEEGEQESDSPEQPPKDKRARITSTRLEAPTGDLRKRLLKQMERYLDQLSDASFVRMCTATRLVQAAAFPLAVAAKALDGGWIDHEAAAYWVIRVCDLLFRAEISRDIPQPGLLNAVLERYKLEGRDDTFGKVVGDGTLWVALAGAVSQVDWSGTSRGLDRGLALREVFEEPILTLGTGTGRLSYLLSRLQTGDTRGALLLEASKVAQVIGDIERILEKDFPSFQSSQIGGRHIAGDPLWNPHAGFARAEEDAPIDEHSSLQVHLRKRGEVVKIKANFYVNVRLAAKASPQLADLLTFLAPCWPGH